MSSAPFILSASTTLNNGQFNFIKLPDQTFDTLKFASLNAKKYCLDYGTYQNMTVTVYDANYKSVYWCYRYGNVFSESGLTYAFRDII